MANSYENLVCKITQIAEMHQKIAEAIRGLAEDVRSLSAGDQVGVISSTDAGTAIEPAPIEGESTAESVEGVAIDTSVCTRITTYLQEHGFEIVRRSDYAEIPEAWFQLAEFIAERYDNVKDFVQRIKQTQNQRQTLQMSLRGASQDEVRDTTLLGNRAAENGLVSHYVYRKSPAFELRCTPPDHPEAINFWTGKWLELSCIQPA